MSAVRADVLWRIKPGVKIKEKDMTYFCPGGYTFTHKSGEHVSFDFEQAEGGYEEEDGIIDWSHKEIDNEFITSGLLYDNLNNLVQEQYDVEFFKEGKIDLDTIPMGQDYPIDEMHCCMDLIINGVEMPEVDDSEFIEPIYCAVYDPYNPTNRVELFDKTTPEERKKYVNVF